MEAAQAFLESAHELLVADDEDDLAGGIGIGAELAARAGPDDALAVLPVRRARPAARRTERDQ